MKNALGNPLIRAGIVLGIGFGGLADGILLHQILGWHHLICVTWDCQVASVAQLQREIVQDGYFHLSLWFVLLLGTIMLFRAASLKSTVWSIRILSGALLAGCGLFNFCEGLIDHQILGIHHLLPGNPHQFAFDMLFLAVGLLLVLIGAVLASPKTEK